MARGIDNIKYEEDFIVNLRGMKLFVCRWLPRNKEPTALIFLCHGYAMECSISMRNVGILLAKSGYGVYGLDYEGHGKSEGLQGYVPVMENLIKDVSDYYTSVCERAENATKMRILMGESMGGAVALRLHRLNPNFWDGAVLIAPMCKLADGMKPNPRVMDAVSKIRYLFPKWKIVPSQDIIDVGFRDPNVRKEIRANSYCYKGNLRLLTAIQLLSLSLDLEKHLEEVQLPFLVVHGGGDKVVDPSVSKRLYECALSKDKTFNLYPGMWHSLSYGEFPENIDIVFRDVLAWLNDRVPVEKPKLETQPKHKFDELVKASSTKRFTIPYRG